MTTYFIKIIISATIIAVSTELAKRHATLGGLILSLPLTSLLAYLIMGYENADVKTLTSYARSTLIFVPVSLIFFLPFALPIFDEWSFLLKFISGLSALILSNFVLMKFVLS
jgi:hypothetical protein